MCEVSDGGFLLKKGAVLCLQIANGLMSAVTVDLFVYIGVDLATVARSVWGVNCMVASSLAVE